MRRRLGCATEAWLIIGRRGGKSFVLALIAAYLACFFEYRRYLQPGERGSVLVLAATAKQARVIFRYIRGLLTEVPLLKVMIERETIDSFDLNNGVSIEVNAASYRSVRGYTVLAALCDEIAFWPQEDAADPDHEVLNAIRPAMSTIPNAMLLAASSPYARKGALFEAYRRHHGQNGDPILLWHAPTRVMNPSVPQAVIDAATERDPAHASAEYGAQFRTDVESYIKLDVVERCVAIGVSERPPLAGISYKAFIDPSGGANDSMTLGIAHREDKLVVIDKLVERKPPFSPASVVSEFARALKPYRIVRAIGDKYAGEWPREQFRSHGITYEANAKPKNDLYIALLPLLTSQMIDLVDVPRLISQIASLERRTARGGRDSIDHPPNGHDDCANAIAGVASMFMSTSRYITDLVVGRWRRRAA